MLKLKICGMRRPEDIEMANRHKPDYIGFVFADSPRKVSYEQAKELSELLSDAIVPVNYIKNLKAKSLEQTGSEIPVINAIEIRDTDDDADDCDDTEDINYNKRLLEWRDSVSDYFILDSGKGSGKTFNWELVDSEILSKPFFLAGGLNSENLSSAIEEFNPFAVDLSSSVETDGFKDEEKIKEIIEIIENYR